MNMSDKYIKPLKNDHGVFEIENYGNFSSGIFLFLIYSCLSCLGLYLMKSALAVQSLVFLFGFSLYCLGAVVWMVILRLLPLSFAFPVASGVLVVGTMLTGLIFLGENLTVWQVIGAGLIVVGIALTAFGR